MDPLCHTLSGVLLAKTGLKRKIGNGCLLALVLASNVTDIDIFGMAFLDQPNWMFRRMWTHSLITSPVLMVLCAGFFALVFPQKRFLTWLGIMGLGVGLHIAMDLLNSYGVVLLFPLSYQRFELAWVFIIDIYLWGILLAALLIPPAAKLFGTVLSAERFARIGLGAVLAYILLCGALREYSMMLLERHASAHNPNYSFSYVFPEPFGPWRFHGVIKTESTYRSFLVAPLRGTIEARKSYHSDERDPAIARLINSETGRPYQWFFKAPVWERIDRDTAVVSDIRFKSLLLERDAPFRYTLPLHTTEQKTPSGKESKSTTNN